MTPDVLGKLADRHSERDAVHIAIVPLTAVAKLYPGQMIAVVESQRAVVPDRPSMTIGIVDPFLSRAVEAGERFWCCLYPGTITSLRHEWTHPAFEDSESAAWLKKFCVDIGHPYSDFLQMLDNYAVDGDNEPSFGSETARDDVQTSWKEICYHYLAVSGNRLDPGGDAFFRCAC